MDTCREPWNHSDGTRRVLRSAAPRDAHLRWAVRQNGNQPRSACRPEIPDICANVVLLCDRCLDQFSREVEGVE